MAMTGPATSRMAAREASLGESPSSMWRSTASTTMIASSTTSPMASTRPNSDRVLIENPRSGKTANVPISETGTARAGMSVALHPWRKTKTTRMTRARASARVIEDFMDAFVDRPRRIEGDCILEIGGKALLSLIHQLFDRLHGGEGVRAGHLVNGHHPGRPAVDPAPDVVHLGAQLDAGHVLQPHYRAVGIGAEDDGAEFLRRNEAALGLDGVGKFLPRRDRLAADLPRRIDRVLFLHRAYDIGDGNPQLAERVRIDPDADGVVPSAEHRDLGHAGRSQKLVDDVYIGVVCEKGRIVSPPGE